MTVRFKTNARKKKAQVPQNSGAYLANEKETEMRRSKIKKSKSKRDFSRTGSTTHKKNLGAAPMRGGIRL